VRVSTARHSRVDERMRRGGEGGGNASGECGMWPVMNGEAAVVHVYRSTCVPRQEEARYKCAFHCFPF
jgi:hypothetical protein